MFEIQNVLRWKLTSSGKNYGLKDDPFPSKGSLFRWHVNFRVCIWNHLDTLNVQISWLCWGRWLLCKLRDGGEGRSKTQGVAGTQGPPGSNVRFLCRRPLVEGPLQASESQEDSVQKGLAGWSWPWMAELVEQEAVFFFTIEASCGNLHVLHDVNLPGLVWSELIPYLMTPMDDGCSWRRVFYHLCLMVDYGWRLKV